MLFFLKQMFLVGLFALGISLLTGCASPGVSYEEEYESPEPSVIIKGQTALQEVIEMLGNPSVITETKKQQLLWVYRNQAAQDKAASPLFLLGGKNKYFTAESSHFDLFLTFGKDNLVADFFTMPVKFWDGSGQFVLP